MKSGKHRWRTEAHLQIFLLYLPSWQNKQLVIEAMYLELLGFTYKVCLAQS